MMKIKEKNKLLLVAISCIVVFVVIFSVIFYNFIIKKDIPRGGAGGYITLNVYEKDTNRNLIIWWVVDGGMAEGRAWDEFYAYILVNGTFYTNVTLPPGTVNKDDLIVTYVPVRGRIQLFIGRKEPIGTMGSRTVEFY